MATETTETLPPTGATSSPLRSRLQSGRLGRMGAARRGPTVATWLVASVAFLAFIGFGSVRIETGSADGRFRRVVDTWSRFANNLPKSGHQDLLRAVFFGALAILIAGVIVGLWLAMRAEAEPADSSPPAANAPE